MDNPRHSTKARARFIQEFAAAVKAIEKLPPRPKRQLVDVRPETEAGRSFPSHQDALKLGYFARTASYGKLRDTTTDYNESMFMARNIAKAGRM